MVFEAAAKIDALLMHLNEYWAGRTTTDDSCGVLCLSVTEPPRRDVANSSAWQSPS
jgi:hypothetical protein